MDAVLAWLAAHPLIATLLALQAADIAMGVCLAFGAKRLSSSVTHKGFLRKTGTLIVVGISYLLQRHMPDAPLGHLVCTAFIGQEGLSIVENAALLGVPIPRSLREALAKLQEEKTPKQEAKKRIEVKADSVIVKGRDTTHEIETVRGE